MALSLASLTDQTFNTYKDLETAVQEFAKEHGYVIVIGRSHKSYVGNIKSKVLTCVKGGRVRDRVIDRKKPLISQKTDCPFKCKAQLDGDSWKLIIVNPDHNHELSDPIAFHQHRKFPEEIRLQVAALPRAGIKPKEISSAIAQTYPDQLWRIQDIYNLR